MMYPDAVASERIREAVEKGYAICIMCPDCFVAFAVVEAKYAKHCPACGAKLDKVIIRDRAVTASDFRRLEYSW